MYSQFHLRYRTIQTTLFVLGFVMMFLIFPMPGHALTLSVRGPACPDAGGIVTASRGILTASLPLVLSGSNLSLPDVIIDTIFANTSIGPSALSSKPTGTYNTASGFAALKLNTTGFSNTASGSGALSTNTTGGFNTASGYAALDDNITGNYNTAIGYDAGPFGLVNLENTTAIGSEARVTASNTIQLGNSSITGIFAQVGLTATSDKNQKENFQPVDGEDVLAKIGDLNLTSWNFIGQDPKQFRHYGPVAQEFYAAFGHDGVGTIGNDTTINSTDMAGILMIAIQTLTKQSKAQEHQAKALEKQIKFLMEDNAVLKARLDQLIDAGTVTEAAIAP